MSSLQMHNNETGADAKIALVKVKALKVAQIIALDRSKQEKKVFYQVANKADGSAHCDPFPGVHSPIHQHAGSIKYQEDYQRIRRKNNFVTLE